MKIAILTPTFLPHSGIDRLVEIEAKKWVNKKHQVDIFTLKGSLRIKKVRVIEIGIPKNHFLQRIYRLLFFLDAKKISKYINILKKYDIIISHLYPMNVLAFKTKKKYPKVKYIYHNAGVGIVNSYSFFEQFYLNIFNFLNNYTIKNCDSVVSISNFLRNELKKSTGKNSKVEYIDVDKVKYHKKINGNKIRNKYGISKNTKVFLYVGRISPHKGIHLLIKSFIIYNRKVPNAKLIIVGKHTFTHYSKKLKKMANKNIIFSGFVPDKLLPFYYAACDVYTTASLWEGFDIPAVEAQYCGKPVVAFNIGSHPEVINNGIMVKASDTSAFATALLKVT